MNPRVLGVLLRPTRGELSVLALPFVAFASVAALVLTVVSGAQPFWGWTDPEAPVYQILASVALVLLIVPLLTLGGSAARLSARRRDDRLSTLRLLGVTPRGVVVLTVIESTAVAAAGAIAGLVVSYVLTPLVGLILFRGEPLGWPGVVLPLTTALVITAGIVLLAAVSAVIGLRKVVISPLGVRTRATATPVHWIRAVITVIVLGTAFAVVSGFSGGAGILLTVVVIVGVLGGASAVLNLIGPWVLGLQAKWRLRRARTPEQLLSARSVLDAPKAAWRQVSAVAMTSFIAVVAGAGVALMDAMGSGNAADAMLAADIRTGLVITLVASFLMLALSVGLNQAAQIVDRHDLNASLHRLGMGVETIDRSRRQAIMAPLLLTIAGSVLSAGPMVAPLIGTTILTAPLSLLTIAVVTAGGVALVAAALRATRPLLRATFAAA